MRFWSPNVSGDDVPLFQVNDPSIGIYRCPNTETASFVSSGESARSRWRLRRERRHFLAASIDPQQAVARQLRVRDIGEVARIGRGKIDQSGIADHLNPIGDRKGVAGKHACAHVERAAPSASRR